jgi:hypothetical protein
MRYVKHKQANPRPSPVTRGQITRMDERRNDGRENYKLAPTPELLMEFRQFLESGPD